MFAVRTAFCWYARWWWHTPLIPALRRQRQVDLCELEASLVYKESSRTARAITQRGHVSKNQAESNNDKKPPTNQTNKQIKNGFNNF